ncbi:histone-like nucleoid-structuring protein Lsr2 [Nakamurella endophytica]|uniref:Protein lsr2 n=1 Tax=Nakamurella endophytica TaxID=1748367 RepID=A0A917WK80_9ACTN|nr:Lsr2 family protein [Nakamurella endophytica]GGM10239.1 protein lsr2 precursor [Nakamurella endophytica]
MAAVTHTHLVDDLDGATDDVATVRFALDGRDYEIDLSKGNQQLLRKELDPYLTHARRLPGPAGRPARNRVGTSGSRSREQLHAIREWANRNGYPVSPRGRLSNDVLTAFDDAHPTTPTAAE